MQKTTLIITALLLMSVLAVSVFLAYSNHTQVLDYDDMSSNAKYITDDGYFKGSFKSKLKGKYICSYDTRRSGGNVYITAYVTTDKEKAISTNNQGYCTFLFYVGDAVDSVIYTANGDEVALSYGKQHK